MKIKFLQDCELVVVESYDEETDTTEESNETFNAGEIVDVDILERRSDSTDWQFGDGSCAYVVPNELFESVGKLIFNEVVKTVEGSGLVRVDGNAALTINFFTPWKYDPDNEAMILLWMDNDDAHGSEFTEHLLEEDFDNAEIKDGNIIITRNLESDGVFHDTEITLSLYRKYEIQNTERCSRCGSPLDKGFCTDDTCPFENHLQSCTKGWLGHPQYARLENNPCNCKE